MSEVWVDREGRGGRRGEGGGLLVSLVGCCAAEDCGEEEDEGFGPGRGTHFGGEGVGGFGDGLGND